MHVILLVHWVFFKVRRAVISRACWACWVCCPIDIEHNLAFFDCQFFHGHTGTRFQCVPRLSMGLLGLMGPSHEMLACRINLA